MKKIKPIYALFIALFLLYAYSGNPPNERTGAPGDGNCTDCHIPNNSGFEGSVLLRGLPEVIMPSTTYNVSVTTKVTAGNPNRGGFQMVILDDDGNNVGTLDNAGDNSGLSDVNGRTYFEQRSITTFNDLDSVVWTVDWTAPSTLTNDSIRVYINSIVGKGSGSAGDLMLTNRSAFGFQSTPLMPVAIDTIIGTDVSCFGESDGMASITASGGDGNLTYEWSNGATTASISGLSIGNYLVTVTDGANDSATASITINQAALLEIALDSITNINCNNMIGNASVVASGGTEPYTFNWSNDSSGAMVDLEAGMHTVTVTDANQCMETLMVTITEDTQLPTVFAGLDVEVTCADTNRDSVQLEAINTSTGTGVNYLWTTTDGNILNGATTLMPVVNASGAYVLTVMNTQNGCEAKDTVLVAFNTMMPTAEAGADQQLDCDNTTVTLDGSASSQGADLIYTWTSPNGSIMSGDSTLMPVVSSAGMYFLMVHNQDNSCSSMDSVLVTQANDLPMANAGMAKQLDCNTTTVTLEGSGTEGDSITYLWTTTDGHFVSGDSTLTPVVDSAGTYTLTVSNTNNNCTAMATVSVTSSISKPMVTIAAPMAITCVKDTTVITATIGNEENMVFAWTSNNGNIISGDSTLSPIVGSAGTYILTSNNTATGCSAIDSVTVMENKELPAADAGTDKQLDCTNTSVTLDGTGATGSDITYSWTSEDGNFVAGDTTLTPMVDASGTYVLRVANTLTGCFSTDTTLVTQDDLLPMASVEEEVLIGCDADTIQVMATASEGTNIVYEWTSTDGNIIGDTNTVNVVVVGAGTYTLTVRDTLNNCSVSVSFDAVMTALPIADAGMNAIIDCANPAITLDGTNSAGNDLIYAWTSENGNILSGANTAMPMVDKAGTYQLQVTDTISKCTATAMVEVTESNSADLFAASGDAEQLTCAQSSITLNATASEGEHIVYEWTTEGGNIVEGGNSLTPTIDAAGKYILTVRDTTNGCTARSSIKIAQDIQLPEVSAGDAMVLDCDTEVVTLNGSSTTLFNLTYTWTTEDGNILSGANTPNPEVNAAGTYTLMVMDTFTNCAATAMVMVTQDAALPTAGISLEGQLDCDTDTLMLNGSGSMGDNILISWSTIDGNIIGDTNTYTTMVDEPGTYTLMVMDTSTSCTNRVSVEVREDLEKPIVEAGAATQFICGGEDLVINAMASEGDNYTYFWCTEEGSIVSGGDSLVVTIDGGGLFEFIVTNTTNACQNVDTVLVADAEAVILTLDTVFAGGATVLATGGLAPYQYHWNTENMDTTAAVKGLQAGDYIVTATDANGCMDTLGVKLELSTGIANLEKEIALFQLYPNPAIDFAQLKIDFNKIQEGSIFIKNSIGQTMWQQRFNDKALSYQLEIDNWMAGIYFVMIQTEAGLKTEELIIIK
jgi:hypothetical protein